MRIGIVGFGNVRSDTGGRTYLMALARALPSVVEGDEVFWFTAHGDRHLYEGVEGIEFVSNRYCDRSPYHKIAFEQLVVPALSSRFGLEAVFHPNNFATLLSPVPVAVSIHSALQYYYPETISRGKAIYRRVMTALTVRKARAVVVPSAWLADDLSKRFSVHRSMLRVVPHGVHHAQFTPDDSAVRVPGVVRGRPYFLFVSALWPYKGLETAMDAFAEFGHAQRGAEHLLVIVGWGAKGYVQSLMDRARRLGVLRRIVWTGFVDHSEMPAFYRHSEALLFPSYCEAFGHPLLEAMASGTPVIASNRQAIPEVCAGAALVCDPDYPLQWAEAMSRIWLDPALRSDLAAKGIGRAARFSWKDTAREILGVLRSL